jgi:hypothetical protein
VVGAVGHLITHHVLHPPPEVLGECGPTGLSEQSRLCPGHLLLKLLEGLLLSLGVDVADAVSRGCWVFELPDPAPVALALVAAAFSVDPSFGFLCYGLLLSSVTSSRR